MTYISHSREIGKLGIFGVLTQLKETQGVTQIQIFSCIKCLNFVRTTDIRQNQLTSHEAEGRVGCELVETDMCHIQNGTTEWV